MKIVFAALVAALSLGAQAASAEGLQGFKFGGDIDFGASRYADTLPTLGVAKFNKTVHEARYRLFAGYDKSVADVWLVGAELGVSAGGSKAQQNVGTGLVKIEPGLSYDVSVRTGFMPSPNSVAFVRAGYNWDRFEEKISPPAPAVANILKKSQGGPLMGVGYEQGIGSNYLVRVEFDYSGFDEKKRQERTLRIGAGYRF
jgi:outer membrane immunogenic protein